MRNTWLIIGIVGILIFSGILISIYGQGLLTTTQDFPTTDGDFGEKSTIWTKLGGIFRGEEFSFVSETPESDYLTEEYGPLQKEAYDTELACYNCEEGDFCRVYYMDDTTNEKGSDLFSDYWYMSYSRDYLNLADSDYWTRPETFTYGYTCYTPPEPDTYLYSCRENSAEDSASIYHDGQVERKIALAECELSEKEYTSQPSLNTVEDDMINRLDKCYSCDGSEAITDVRDGCSGEWTSSTLTDSDCEDLNTVQCYSCDEEQGIALSDTYEGSCPSGWQESELTDEDCKPEPEPIKCYQCVDGQQKIEEHVDCPSGWSEDPLTCETTCYTCSNGSVESIEVTGSCPDGYVSSRPASCEPDLTRCYTCSDGIVQSEYMEECTGEFTSKKLTEEDCQEKIGFFEKVFDFKNNPEQASLAVLAVLSVVISAFMMFSGNGKKEKGGSIGL